MMNLRDRYPFLMCAKIPYFNATKNLDRACHDLITPVNDTIYAVRDAYDERVDDQECRSELFWRLVGITSTSGGQGPGQQDTYHFKCTQLSTMYEKTDISGITSTT